MSLTINAMTQEKLSLALPVMFTVGPEDSVEKLKNYAILLTGNTKQDSSHVQNVIKGVIEGEIRYEYMEVCLINSVLIAKMSMEELFQGRQQFKENITKHIQAELDQFGIKICISL
jgi:flotillin